MKKLNLSTYALILLFCAFSAPKLAFSQDDGTQVGAWPGGVFERFRLDARDEFGDLGQELQASIFESLADIKWSDDIGDFNFGLRFRRRVFDNQDILNTWTVVDFFQVPFGLPINILDPVTFGTQGVARLNLDVNLSLDSFHIRQVRPEDLEKLPKLSELEKQVKAKENEIDSDDTTFEEPQGLSDLLRFRSENPRTRARYGKFLNLFTSVLGLPLTPKKALEMPSGDVRSYSLNGAVQFGPSVGWGVVETPGAKIGYSAGFSTFVRGKWQVSTMKEEENKIQLKITRQTGRGFDTYLGSETEKYEIFEGFLIAGNEIGKIEERLIPFHFNARKETTKSFDIGYRYDLDHPKAKKAYSLAVFGRLALSDQLAQEGDQGVEVVFTRDQESQDRYKQYRLKLSLIYQRVRSQITRVSSAIVTINDEEFHVFKGEAQSSKSSDTILGTSEYQGLKFVTTIDTKTYNASDKGLNFAIEGRFEDAYTSYREYMQTIATVENATGMIDLFPRVPLQLPKGVEDPCANPSPQEFRQVRQRRNTCSKNAYGQMRDTSFSYRMAFNTEQLNQFINYPEEQMWSALEQAFGVHENSWSKPSARFWYGFKTSYATALNIPLMLVDQHIDEGQQLYTARAFYKRWKDLKDVIDDPQTLATEMSELFSTTHFGHEVLNLFKLTLEKNSYALNIQARAPKIFGQISKQVGEFDYLDRRLQRSQEEIDFDRIGSRSSFDPDAQIEKLSLNFETTDKVEINFFLNERPEFLFFIVDQSSGWFRYQNLLRSIIYNNDLFKKGANTLTVRRSDTEGLKGELAKHLFNNERLIFKMAVSQDGERWGAVSSDEIKPSRR